MKIEQLEDFLCLTETRNFSAAAVKRNLSRPALSRRIQDLEEWLGAELLDRSSTPLRLTAAGRKFKGIAHSLIRQIHQAKALLGGQKAALTLDQEVQFGIAYTLALTHFPEWFAGLQAHMPSINAHIRELTVFEGANALISGAIDLLITYHHPNVPIPLDTERYPCIAVGRESVRPYSLADANGKPVFSLPGSSDQAIPYLAYAPTTFFAHVVDMILLRSEQPYYLQPCFQTHISEGLKAMIIAGLGVGWLPEQCITRELKEGKIIPAGPPSWGTYVDLRVYRSIENTRPVINDIWSFLSSQENLL